MHQICAKVGRKKPRNQKIQGDFERKNTFSKMLGLISNSTIDKGSFVQ